MGGGIVFVRKWMIKSELREKGLFVCGLGVLCSAFFRHSAGFGDSLLFQYALLWKLSAGEKKALGCIKDPRWGSCRMAFPGVEAPGYRPKN